MITAENISLSIGPRMALDQVSAQIPSGKVTVILGPNGAGKSTLLKCLAGALHVHDGAISINGKPLNAYTLSELSRTRSVLSQSIPVSFPFTVEEIVQMGRAPYEGDSLTVNSNVTYQVLNSIDGLHLMNRTFQTLSGGEQQRIQFARVLAQIWGASNTYLFLDEPTSALDLKHQHQMLRLVKTLSYEKQVGVCVVMHDLQMAMRYADYVLLMQNGKLFASGDITSVLSRSNIETVFEVSASLVFD